MCQTSEEALNLITVGVHHRILANHPDLNQVGVKEAAASFASDAAAEAELIELANQAYTRTVVHDFVTEAVRAILTLTWANQGLARIASFDRSALRVVLERALELTPDIAAEDKPRIGPPLIETCLEVLLGGVLFEAAVFGFEDHRYRLHQPVEDEVLVCERVLD